MNLESLQNICQNFKATRLQTELICKPLQTEDFVVQPIEDVSPPKWHLAHTTWFFEQFVLVPNSPNYKVFNPDFAFLFNSYYESVGKRVMRTNRGNLSRPSVAIILEYRAYVTHQMIDFLQQNNIDKQLYDVILLGINHEQQHQELLLTDIKYILGHQPFFPLYGSFKESTKQTETSQWLDIDAGMYNIGYNGDGFCFDNELGQHQVYLPQYSISNQLVSNKEFIEFIEDGGYQNHNYWHSEGWAWLQNKHIKSPMYYHKIDGIWYKYELEGLQKIEPNEPISHVSYFEAAAFAAWKGCRLPTEFEWEVAADQLNWGQRWEHTNSAYLAYPNYSKASGAIGEYNGKFMVNQMVLRGASVATAQNHSRKTYRNFFHPHLQWQFTGIRLAK